MKRLNQKLNFSTNSTKGLKSAILTLIIMMVAGTAWAQTGTSYGIKAGLNYNANGDYFESIGAVADNPERNIGFHIGAFGKIGNQIYFRPELMYTKTRSEYDTGEFDMQKIDAPLLVGLKVIGPLSVFAGPAFQYILDTEFDDISIENVDNDLSVGFNFGLGLNLNKVGIDIRYERGFTDNEAQFLINNNIDVSRLDTRPDQIILSLSVAL